jgi:hypothetical protein
MTWKPHPFATGCLVLALASVSSSASAKWGCAFSGTDIKGNFGRVWGGDTEPQTREAALALCRRDHQGCYIVGCDPRVDSKADADALWPMKGIPLRQCGVPGWPECPHH